MNGAGWDNQVAGARPGLHMGLGHDPTCPSVGRAFSAILNWVALLTRALGSAFIYFSFFFPSNFYWRYR